MPYLLVHACPTCEDGRFSLATHVGDVVCVMPDDHVFSDLERKHFLVVQTDKPLAECVALLCVGDDATFRLTKLDVSRLPAEKVKAVIEFKKAVDAVRPAGHEAKAIAYEEAIAALGISPSKAAKILTPDPKKKVGFGWSAKDEMAAAIRGAQGHAWDVVVGTVERQFAPSDPVFVSSTDLDAMVVMK